MIIRELEQKSIQYRKTILRIIKRANAGHIGGSLSCVDILNVLYNLVLNVSPETIHSPDRDRYIHSKGHSSQALYAVLADRGFFREDLLDNLSQYKSEFFGHPSRRINGIEQNTGALGHGLPMAVGTALAGKIDRRSFRVFTLLGDGELAEGSNWEAMMAAAHYELDNLTAIVDRNTLQITGRTEDVLGLEPLDEKFRSFGFEVHTANGNNIAELIDVFSEMPFQEKKPNMVIAKTTKGKGISFMEDNASWHHRVPNDEEYQRAMEELENAEVEMGEKFG